MSSSHCLEEECQELDALFVHMKVMSTDRAKSLSYRPPPPAEMLEGFSLRLHRLLLLEGFDSRYVLVTPDYYRAIRVYYRNEYYYELYMDTFSIHLKNCPYRGVRKLLTDLHQTINRELVREYCFKCHYCDRLIEYCGIGLEMEVGCTSRRDKQELEPRRRSRQ